MGPPVGLAGESISLGHFMGVFGPSGAFELVVVFTINGSLVKL